LSAILINDGAKASRRIGGVPRAPVGSAPSINPPALANMVGRFPNGGTLALLVVFACTAQTTAHAQPARAAVPPAVQMVTPMDARTITDPEQLDERMPSHLVQDLHAAFGARGVRAVHAKGYILQGSFTPSAEARRLSRAAVFMGQIPVIVRFSDFTGLPSISDTNPLGQPRGFAVKFLLPDGSNLDIENHSFNGFPSPTAADFGDLLRAIAASGPDAAKPTPLERYLGSHPVAKAFLTSQSPPPESWATTAYYGVNAYAFISAAGKVTYLRYQFTPQAGEHSLSPVELATKGPNYLTEEISQRVARSPIRFTWYAQLAGQHDDVANPSIAWPRTRRLVKLGVITIDKAGPNTALADRSLSFLPGSTPPGIAAADPMLTIRNAAYPISFAERRQATATR
jgi:catalase